jgi:hypothetical protein
MSKREASRADAVAGDIPCGGERLETLHTSLPDVTKQADAAPAVH